MLSEEEIKELMVECVKKGEVVMLDDKKWSEYTLYKIVQQAIHANDYQPTERDFEPIMKHCGEW
jgi:hypothetical protein